MASRQAAAFLAVLALLAAPAAVRGLSWPLCADGGQVWVTPRPHTEPTFPGADLWFFCQSGLNLLGLSVSGCINNGTLCTSAIPDALCQALGFDRSMPDGTSLAPAAPDEGVRALTGEYCLRKGTYSLTLPDDLATLPGEPCMKLDSLTCIRTTQTIVTALDGAILTAFKPAPPAVEPVVQPEVVSPAEAANSTVQAAGGGGRRLRF